MTTTTDILKKTRDSKPTNQVEPVTFMLDGEPLGKQLGRVQRTVTHLARSWTGTKKEYQDRCAETLQEFLDHACTAVKMVSGVEKKGASKTKAKAKKAKANGTVAGVAA